MNHRRIDAAARQRRVAAATADAAPVAAELGRRLGRRVENAENEAIRTVRAVLSNYSIGAEIQLQADPARREAGFGTHGIIEGEVNVNMMVRPARGASLMARIPVMFKDGAAHEPTVMYVGQSMYLLDQGAFDELLKQGSVSDASRGNTMSIERMCEALERGAGAIRGKRVAATLRRERLRRSANIVDETPEVEARTSLEVWLGCSMKRAAATDEPAPRRHSPIDWEALREKTLVRETPAEAEIRRRQDAEDEAERARELEQDYAEQRRRSAIEVVPIDEVRAALPNLDEPTHLRIHHVVNDLVASVRNDQRNRGVNMPVSLIAQTIMQHMGPDLSVPALMKLGLLSAQHWDPELEEIVIDLEEAFRGKRSPDGLRSGITGQTMRPSMLVDLPMSLTRSQAEAAWSAQRDDLREIWDLAFDRGDYHQVAAVNEAMDWLKSHKAEMIAAALGL